MVVSIAKQQLEEIFSKTFILRPPKNVIVLDKPATEIICNGGGCTLAFFRGLQPTKSPDIIILTSLANSETVLHETWHTYGVDERGAYPMGKLSDLIFKKVPRIRKREVKYQRCTGCDVVKDLDKLGIRSPPKSHPIHFVRVVP